MLASFGSGHGGRHNFIVASRRRQRGRSRWPFGTVASSPSTTPRRCLSRWRPPSRQAAKRPAAGSSCGHGRLLPAVRPTPRRRPSPLRRPVQTESLPCSAWVDFATAAVRVLLSAQPDPALPSRFRPSSKDFWSAQQPFLASMQPAPDRSRPTLRNSAPRPSAAPPPATPPPLPPPTCRPLSAASTNPCCAPAATSTSRSPPPTPPTTESRRSDSACPVAERRCDESTPMRQIVRDPADPIHQIRKTIRTTKRGSIHSWTSPAEPRWCPGSHDRWS